MIALAGCIAAPSPIPSPGPSPSPSPNPSLSPSPSLEAGDDCAGRTLPSLAEDPGFGGANAFGHVLRIVCDFDTLPPAVRDRSPGTPGRAAAGDYLAGVLEDHGWRVTRQDFSGGDYLALEKGSAGAFINDESCSSIDLERLRTLTFSNVVAESGTGPDLWILMAHYDAKAEASSDPDPRNRSQPVPGANDGASGVGVWLEAARVLVARSGATLRIVLVDGEDGFEDCHPLAGSLFHARSMDDDERSRIRGVYVLDMVGDPEAEFCYGHDAPELRGAIVESAAELRVAALADAPDCTVIDDHTAFADLGVPALDLIDFRGGAYPPYWHTLRDVPSRLSPDTLAGVGRVMVRALGRLGAA